MHGWGGVDGVVGWLGGGWVGEVDGVVGWHWGFWLSGCWVGWGTQHFGRHGREPLGVPGSAVAVGCVPHSQQHPKNVGSAQKNVRGVTAHSSLEAPSLFHVKVCYVSASENQQH